ncbi:class I SAM-dependent methyltransferase [Shewanella sp. NIFS-20-20]|uniref:class I SAM-dependent methyltransferase n=1 Tax=Shewanella sp. NIFS-20-20 TaxID=2853806 RepID=UPI001C490592|nr:class I SAM-dependent methyltransferase [Shewanella sp. NIFS-20-20]MBV7315117.1 class I SAM-dependent methyltransferase [Shewanella sp. NIFS-20-20]
MDYSALNKAAWDKRTLIHVHSRFYDVDGFIQGRSSLNPIELGLMGEVIDKNLLHLQCHFGLDSLSWARLGARVTGVDFSTEAIHQARQLAQQLSLTADFTEADVYRFGDTVKPEFDLVFTSYGVLCWLACLDSWAQTIAKALVPGGRLVLVEFHPAHELLSGYDYFPKAHADLEEEGTYTDNALDDTMPIATWSHSLAEVIGALINAGLVIDHVGEHPYSPYPCSDDLEAIEQGGYQALYQGKNIPLLYSISATKAQ